MVAAGWFHRDSVRAPGLGQSLRSATDLTMQELPRPNYLRCSIFQRFFDVADTLSGAFGRFTYSAGLWIGFPPKPEATEHTRF